jgi:uracil-DNA glycosylase
MEMRYPWNLDYWKSGEWQAVNERLHDMEKRNEPFCPGRPRLFDCLRNLDIHSVNVCIIAQDPYPSQRFATGQAFSIQADIPPENFPPTLRTIFRELSRDLHLPSPSTGSLSRWVDQGVLLYNAIPTCRAGESLSHDWGEYSYLTNEIIRRLAERGIVFAFVGSVARRYVGEVSKGQSLSARNEIIEVGHPSARGTHGKIPFQGSRIFSTINDRLNKIDRKVIDWELP